MSFSGSVHFRNETVIKLVYVTKDWTDSKVTTRSHSPKGVVVIACRKVMYPLRARELR